MFNIQSLSQTYMKRGPVKLIGSALCLAALSMTSTGVQAQVAVVVGAQSSVNKLSTDQVAELFTGKQAVLPGGGTVQLVDLPDSSPIRTHFYEKGVGKSVKQAKALWARLLFAGQGIPPVEASDAAGVKKTLSSNPNALGYIEKSAVDNSVKVLLLVE